MSPFCEYLIGLKHDPFSNFELLWGMSSVQECGKRETCRGTLKEHKQSTHNAALAAETKEQSAASKQSTSSSKGLCTSPKFARK